MVCTWIEWTCAYRVVEWSAIDGDADVLLVDVDESAANLLGRNEGVVLLALRRSAHVRLELVEHGPERVELGRTFPGSHDVGGHLLSKVRAWLWLSILHAL